MRKLTLALFTLFCLTISAQKTVTLDKIAAGWQSRTLKVAGNDSPSIVDMAETFQKQWPTYSGGEMLKFAKRKGKYENTDKVVDLANGYVLYSEDDPDSENDEQFQARQWERTDGHRLVAFDLHRFSGETDVLCFYDYDPKTRTLTPDDDFDGFFIPSFPGYRGYRVFLPQHGDNITVNEYIGFLTITHTYLWDGMNMSDPVITIEQIDFFQGTFAERHFFSDEHPFTSYALVDIDGDEYPELWLRSDDETYQGVFAVKQTCDLLGGQSDRRTLSFYKGAVCEAGTCGAGCMSSAYCLLSESCYKKWITETSEYDYTADEYGDSKYTIDGKEVPASVAEKVIESLGEEVTLPAEWRELSFPAE